jgi:hypothetical protein
MPVDDDGDFSSRMSLFERNDDSFRMAHSSEEPGEEKSGKGYYLAIGSKRSWMPILGERTWEVSESDERAGYYAYIFLRANREVGYIRIPNFERNDTALAQFRNLVQLFERRTKVMVLNIVENPGGSMYFMYALVSMLTDRNLSVPRHVVAITEDDVAVAEDVLANSDDEPPERVNYSRTILTEFKAGRWGRGRRSHPLYLGGITQITPSKTRYTGKVLVLVNELTFSAGEFLAAIVKDNGLHTIFGTRTVGAGGVARKVNSSKLPPGLVSLTLTWTYAYRTNGELIENMGIEPDIVCPATIEDLRSKDPFRTDDVCFPGYQPYRQKLLEAIDTLHSSPSRSSRPETLRESITPKQLHKVLDRHKVWRQGGNRDIKPSDECQRAILQRLKLSGAALRAVDLSWANLSETDLSGADLRKASLAWANLREANLSGADLRGADLSHAYLVSANLSGAKLMGASLRAADLSRAILRNTKFGDCDMFDAYLAEAVLDGSDLCGQSGART